MKAMLEIDIPDGSNIDCLTIDYQLYKQINQYGDEMAVENVTDKKLKLIPRKLDANDWHRMFSGNYEIQEAKGYGWNACLKEILGEIE